jgi:hypothetical protein
MCEDEAAALSSHKILNSALALPLRRSRWLCLSGAGAGTAGSGAGGRCARYAASAACSRCLPARERHARSRGERNGVVAKNIIPSSSSTPRLACRQQLLPLMSVDIDALRRVADGLPLVFTRGPARGVRACMHAARARGRGRLLALPARAPARRGHTNNQVNKQTGAGDAGRGVKHLL